MQHRLPLHIPSHQRLALDFCQEELDHLLLARSDSVMRTFRNIEELGRGNVRFSFD